jgi:hypothetical protein
MRFKGKRPKLQFMSFEEYQEKIKPNDMKLFKKILSKVKKEFAND